MTILRCNKGTGRPIDPRIRDFVRTVYLSRLAKQKELAKFFGFSQATISRIVSERT